MEAQETKNLFRHPEAISRFKASSDFAVGLTRDQKHIVQEVLNSLPRKDLRWRVIPNEENEAFPDSNQLEGFVLNKRDAQFTLTRNQESLANYCLTAKILKKGHEIKSFAIVSVLYAAIEAKILS